MMQQQLPETFPGARYCKVMQASVDAILAPLGIRRRVISKGKRFLNIDAWTGEHFASLLCEHFAKTPSKIPDRNELRAILGKANSCRENNPRILVAQMPERTTQQMVLAIVGGGYHEAWHTKYSKRSPVTVAEAHSILDEAREVLQAGGSFDDKTRGLMLTLHHLIEDIRIERRGNEDFPGAMQPMRDLQDFILSLEATSREEGAKIKNVTVSSNARSILLCCFRDLGLGYDTTLSQNTLEFYKRTSPKAVALVAPGGLLEPMLREAQELSREDGMGSLRVALRMVAALCRAAHQQRSKDPLCCTSCGASAKNLVVRPVRDAAGVKLHGRAKVECRICSLIEEIDLPDDSLELLQAEDEPEEAERPEFDEIDAEDVGAGPDGFGDDERERARSLGDTGLEQSGILVLEGSAKDEEEGCSPLLAIAIDVLGGSGSDGLLSNSSALTAVLNTLRQQEARDLEPGEMRWCPRSPSDDVAKLVESTTQSADAERASNMLRDVSQEVSFLRARFRAMFRAQEMAEISHGVRRGRRLSERMLVESRLDLMSGMMPARAYVASEDRIDTSLAMAVCLDQSGSMLGMRLEVAKCALLLVDPVDKAGGATMAFGFRDVGTAELEPEVVEGMFHRSSPVCYDVFKTFDEHLDNVKWRFAHTRADGGTPMADGVQYGISALNDRSETHRILMVITDGMPDCPHEKVIRRQLRQAALGGITVIGVGIGDGARRVTSVFPVSSWAPHLVELPSILLQQLQKACDFSGRSRGKRAALDGQVTRVRK